MGLSSASAFTFSTRAFAKNSVPLSAVPIPTNPFPNNEEEQHVPNTIISSPSSHPPLLQSISMMHFSVFGHSFSLVQIVLSTLVVLFVTAMLQGAAAIVQYRSRFGTAPSPKVPVHGVVLVESNDNNATTTISDKMQQQQQQQPYASNNGDILRMLLIGDSLAIGVGQTNTCTPVLPESIARVLSKHTGKTVYWTCQGESGASSRWLLRLLQRPVEEEQHQQQHNDNQLSKKNGWDNYMAHPNMTLPMANHTQWKEKLYRYQRRFDPKSLGPYDIVIILTGGNDLKGMLFPFLLAAEEKKFMKEENNNNNSNGGWVDDLKTLISYVSSRVQDSIRDFNLQMEQRIQESLQSIRESADVVSDVLSRDDDDDGGGGSGEQLFSMMNVSLDKLSTSVSQLIEERYWATLRKPPWRRFANNSMTVDTIYESSDGDSYNASRVDDNMLESSMIANNQTTTLPQHLTTITTTTTPLFVLPGLPSRALPSFRARPLRWLAIPIMELLDKGKQQLVSWSLSPSDDEEDDNNTILFVPPPTLTTIIEYEQHTGRIWKEQEQEQLIVSLQSVGQDECQEMVATMQEHAANRPPHTSSSSNNHRRRRPPGTRLFSVDNVHPNEEGYTYWGREIGEAIVREWRQDSNTP